MIRSRALRRHAVAAGRGAPGALLRQGPGPSPRPLCALLCTLLCAWLGDLWLRQTAGGRLARAPGVPAGCSRICVLLAAALLLLLTSGCHKKARVSRRSYPPPPPARRPPSSDHDTASRRPSEVRPAVPRSPVPRAPVVPRGDDNAVPTGKVETGMASWYAPSGRRSANGEMYDGNGMTAAHRTLPLGTLVRVTNLATEQSVEVRITDRGPFVRGRMLDLSTAAAKAAGVYRMGVAAVRMEIVQMRPEVSPIGKWCVQIGAFLLEENANRLRADLSRQYSTSAKVIEFQGATGMWVRINPLGGDRARATAIAQSVRVAEPDAQAYLVRLD